MTKERITLRITGNQELVLKELSETLDVSISMLIRTIIGDWLTKNEDYIYRIIDKKKYGDALYQQVREKEDIFGEEGD
jgi:hypothetical protein